MKVLEPLGVESRSKTADVFSCSQEGIWSELAAYETMIQA